VAKENKLTQMCNYDIPKNFYGFGLEKKLIIRSVAILFGISFLIFIVFQKKILSSYDFELNRVELLKHKGANDILGILIATTLVFFGVKLDYKKMHFTSVVGLILLLAIFTTGIICYGFLANFILTVK
jgi:hypothetical protein